MTKQNKKKKRGPYKKGLGSVVSARKVHHERPGVLVLLNKDQCAAMGVEAGDRVSIETHGDALVVKLHEKKPRT